MATVQHAGNADSPTGECSAEAAAIANLTPSNPSERVKAPAVNDIRLAGRIAGDPLFRTLGGRTIVQFRVAVEKRYKDVYGRRGQQIAYVPVAIGGPMADHAREFLQNGSPIYVEGRLRSHFWKTPDGRQQTGLRLDAYKVQSLARGQSCSRGQEMGD